MNWKQRSVLFISVLLIAASGLAAPRIWTQSCAGIREHEMRGQAWLLASSSIPEILGYYTCPDLATSSLSEAIDIKKLTVEWGTVVLSCVGMLLVLRSSDRK